jgi:hypothetical protein
MALAVDALAAAHDAHREHPVRAHEPSSSRPIAPALTAVDPSAAMRVVSARGTLGLALGIASGFATHVHADENGLVVARVVPRPGGISPDESLLRDTRRRVCWTSATRGQRADEDRGSQGLPGVDDRSCSG